MRELFYGYYRPSEQQLDSLWNEGLIVPDANVLLNVYRYSPSARAALLAALDRFKDRLWIPHQFALEYHRRRIEVIAKQATSCDTTFKEIETLARVFKSLRSHALISGDHLKSLDAISTSLRESKEKCESLLSEDKYLDVICSLFDQRVGPAPDDAARAGLQAEADSRFQNRIPPGYEDLKPKSGVEAFGDYFGWAQILQHAKASNKHVLLVTDDRKNDWWIEKQRGRSIGPRPELLEEFRRVTGALFYMYSPDRFMEIAASRFGIEIEAGTMQEIRDQSESPRDLGKAAAGAPSSSLDVSEQDIIDAPKLYGSRRVTEYLDTEDTPKAQALPDETRKDEPPLEEKGET
jgi:hypothetical protein